MHQYTTLAFACIIKLFYDHFTSGSICISLGIALQNWKNCPRFSSFFWAPSLTLFLGYLFFYKIIPVGSQKITFINK